MVNLPPDILLSPDLVSKKVSQDGDHRQSFRKLRALMTGHVAELMEK
jgi:hypothetical protein